MPVHAQDVLARFQNGERALVYARRKSDGTIYFLADGTAGRDGLRKWVEHELECFLPECPDRRLRLVNRHSSVRSARDGFSHHPGAGCRPNPESLFHQQGKAAVVAWVRANRPSLKVETEVDLGGVRRPDVLITSPDGRRLAIEVQYAALRVEELEARTRSYSVLGVAVQWLFGHSGKQFKVHEGWSPACVTFNDTHRAAVAAGCSVVWLNPVENLVATPYVRSHVPVASGVWRTPPVATSLGWVEVEIEAFDSAIILHPERGFITRAQAGFERERAWYEDAMASHAVAIAEHEAAERLRAQKFAEEAARREKAKEQKAAERATAAARRERDRHRDLEARKARQAAWLTPQRQARLAAVLAENARRLGSADTMAPGPPREGLRPARAQEISQGPRTSSDDERRPCRACGIPVDPILRSGYHLGCEPPERIGGPGPSEHAEEEEGLF